MNIFTANCSKEENKRKRHPGVAEFLKIHDLPLGTNLWL